MVHSPTAFDAHFVRAHAATLYEKDGTLTIIGRDQLIRRLSGDSATLARAVIGMIGAITSRSAILQRLEELSGGPIENPEVIDQILELLVHSGAIARSAGTPAQPAAVSTVPRTKVLLGLTGAVASVDAPMIVRLLQSVHCDVRVIMTPNARRFVSARALEAITHSPVLWSLYSGLSHEPAPHITLAQWADVMLIAPCSATTVSRLAAGDFSDLVAAVALTTRAPVIVAPSMNPAMLLAPAVVRNLELVRQDGFVLVHPEGGIEVAVSPASRAEIRGVMPSPEKLVSVVRSVRDSLPSVASSATDRGVDWEALYRATPLHQLAFFSPVADPDLIARMTELHRPNAKLLDVGCGAGSTALEAVRRGYDTWGIDIAATAIAAARARDTASQVHWITADVLDPNLGSQLPDRFDLIVDRAVMHALSTETRGKYVETLARWLSDDGVVLMKVHDAKEQGRWGTFTFTPRSLAQSVEPHFRVESCEPTVIAGSLQEPPTGWLAVLRRANPG